MEKKLIDLSRDVVIVRMQETDTGVTWPRYDIFAKNRSLRHSAGSEKILHSMDQKAPAQFDGDNSKNTPNPSDKMSK